MCKAAEKYAKSLYRDDLIQGGCTIKIKQVGHSAADWVSWDVDVVKIVSFKAKKAVVRMATVQIAPSLREAAAVYCSMMACWWADPATNPDPEPSFAVAELVDSVLADVSILRLEMVGEAYIMGNILEMAEAEALLRTGWTP